MAQATLLTTIAIVTIFIVYFRDTDAADAKGPKVTDKVISVALFWQYVARNGKLVD